MDKMFVFRLCLLRKKERKYLGRGKIKTKYDKNTWKYIMFTEMHTYNIHTYKCTCVSYFSEVISLR